MKAKLVTIIAVVISASIFCGCSARRSEPIVGKTFTVDKMKVQHGREVYMKHCDKCHPGGEAGLGPAINSNPAPGFLKKFQVRHGLGVMPAFKEGQIKKEDLKDVALYMKARKRF